MQPLNNNQHLFNFGMNQPKVKISIGQPFFFSGITIPTYMKYHCLTTFYGQIGVF
jgi:hypothetical protein